jgi:hypothetical protein
MKKTMILPILIMDEHIKEIAEENHKEILR